MNLIIKEKDTSFAYIIDNQRWNCNDAKRTTNPPGYNIMIGLDLDAEAKGEYLGFVPSWKPYEW